MEITETKLRSLIRGQIRRLFEQVATPAKAGSEQADTKGTLDVKTIAKTLDIDADKFAAAVKAGKAGNRSSAHNATLGDVFVKLMAASPEDTVKVMNVLKKVSAKDEK